MEQLEDRRLLVVQPFQATRLETGTPLPEFNNGSYTLAVADWNLDGQEDMIAVKTKNTASGRVEVSVYSGATNFQTKIAQLTTSLTTSTLERSFRIVQSDPTKKPNLAVFNPGATSGLVTFDLMLGANNFTTSTRYQTPLPTGTHWAFDMADYDGDGIDDVYGILKKSNTHTAEITVLSGKNLGAGLFKTSILHSETPTDNSLDDSFEFRVRKWAPGDTKPDLVAIKRYAPDEFSKDGFTFIWDYEGKFDYTFMRAVVITELRNTPGGSYQFDVRDLQGSATQHDGLPELILFSTNGTGTGRTELHQYTGEYLPSTDYIKLLDGTTVEEVQNLQPGQIVNYRGSNVTFKGLIEGPEGTQALFSNGSFTIAANISVGQVAIQTAFSLLSGAKITAPQGVTVRTGDVALVTSIDGEIDSNFFIESGALAGSSIINGDFIAGLSNINVSGNVLLAIGHSPGTMTTHKLTLNPSVRVEEQLFGLTPGTEYDQIIASDAITLNNPTLVPDVQFPVPAGAEFIVIRNDSALPVTGNFVNEIGTALTEGAVVSTNFGGSGRTARISYRGGDGNDVVIVVDGDYTFTSPSNGTPDVLQVVNDNGVLQFYAGTSLVRARLLAGLNQLIVQGEAGNIDNIQIDYSNGNPLPVGGILLSTGSDSFDTLTLVGGQVDSVAQTLLTSSPSTIAVTSGGTTGTISFSKLAKVNDLLTSSTKSFVSANKANTALITDSGVNGVTRLAVNGYPNFDFANPTQSLSITTGAFVDTVTVNGFGTGFTAGIGISTSTGADRIVVGPTISSLGSLDLSAAQIVINSPAITTSGVQAYTGKTTISSNAVLSGSSLTFNGDVNAVTGGLSLSLNTTGNGTTSLLGAVGNTVAFKDFSTNSDGKTIVKGNINTTSGDLSIANALTLQSNATFKSSLGSVILSGSIDGVFNTVVSAATTATIAGPSIAVKGLSISSPDIILNSSSVITTGAQTYSGPVKLGTTSTLAGSSVRFTSTIDGAGPNLGLNVDTANAGTTSFLGAIGTTQPLKSLTTNADGKTELKGNVIGSGSDFTFNDAVTFLSSISITDPFLGSTTFAGAVNGAFNLQLAVAGSTVFTETVGSTIALGTSAGPALTIASTGSTTFTKSLKTKSHVIQTSTAGPITFQDDVAITAATVDSKFAGNVVLDGLRFISNRGLSFGDATTDQVVLSSSQVTLDIAAGKVSFKSKLTGPESLVKAGAGTMELTNANDYLGSTTLVKGKITRTAANALPATTILNLGAGTNFSLQTFNLAIAGLSGLGDVSLGGRKLTLSGNVDVDYAGVISGTGSVIKSGAGSQGLSGNNTYTGTTTIQAGLLNVPGKIGANAVAGIVSVATGATLATTGLINANVSGAIGSTIRASDGAVLGRDVSVTGFATMGSLDIGSGTVQLLDADTITVGANTSIAGGTLQVARAFTVGSGKTLTGFGTIAAAQGTLAFVGSTASIPNGLLTINATGVSFDANSTLQVTVGQSKLAVNGSVTLNTPTLHSTLVDNAVPGFDYVVIDNDGSDPIVGKFKDLDQGTQFSYGPERFARSLYHSNVPEVANDFVVRPTKMVATNAATVVSPINTTDTVRFSSNASGQTAYLAYTPNGIYGQFRIHLYGPQGTKLKDFAFAPSWNSDEFIWGDIAMKESGDFVVAMNGLFNNVSGIRIFQFKADGTLVSTSPTIRTSVSYFDSVRLAINLDGSGVITWMESNAASTAYRVNFQQFNSDLSMKSAAPVAVTGFLSSQFDRVGVDLNVNGDFVIAWRVYVSSNGQTNFYRTFGRRYGSNGTAIDSAALTLVDKQTDLSGSDIAMGLRADRGMLLAYSTLLNASASAFNTVIRRVSPTNTLLSEKTNEVSGKGSYYGYGLFLSMNDRDEYLVLRSEVAVSKSGSINFNTYRYLAQKYTSNDIPVFAPIDLFVPGKDYVYGANYRIGVLNNDGSLAVLYQGKATAAGATPYKTISISEPQDAVATSLAQSASNRIQLTYDLRAGDTGPLRLKFYKSTDPYVDATDQVLATFDLTSATDLNQGNHTKAFALGAAAGQVPIPGLGLPATDIDYYLLAMLDPDDQMFEIDQEASALDNQARLYIHFNHTPVIAGLPESINYVENAAALPIAPAATISDPDAVVADYANFNGGFLSISMGTTANANDRLSFINQGTAAGQIGKAGTTVKYGGAVIGTFAGGTGTTPLTFTFSSLAATPTAVQALLRLITFETIGDSPSTVTRTVAIGLSDGDGATTSTSMSIIVTAVADNPIISGLAGPFSYTRNATAGVAIASSAIVSDADNGVFTGGQLRVRVTTGINAGNRLYFGSGVSIDAGLNVSVGSTVIGSLSSDGVGTSDLMVSFNASATTALVQTLLRNVRYKTVAGTSGTRTIQFVLYDGAGGTSSPGTVKTITS